MACNVCEREGGWRKKRPCASSISLSPSVCVCEHGWVQAFQAHGGVALGLLRGDLVQVLLLELHLFDSIHDIKKWDAAASHALSCPCLVGLSRACRHWRGCEANLGVLCGREGDARDDDGACAVVGEVHSLRHLLVGRFRFVSVACVGEGAEAKRVHGTTTGPGGSSSSSVIDEEERRGFAVFLSPCPGRRPRGRPRRGPAGSCRTPACTPAVGAGCHAMHRMDYASE